MIAALTFWLAKLMIDLLPALILFILAMLLVISRMARQARCPHDGDVSETNACDAICGKCGKNLGFIGTWRAKRKDGAA